jgi:hypothetical protein
MLLSALDPTLLFYKLEDWQARKTHCFDRFRALVLHFRVTREYGQQIAMTGNLEGLIYQFFPWNADFKNISELRDLRNFVLNDIQRVRRIDAKVAGDIDLRPTGIVCKYVEDPGVIAAWEELLHGCIDEISAGFDPQIATWDTLAVRQCDSMSLTIRDSEEEIDVQYDLPLVWDRDSWATQLVKQDWWPDLQRCVELEFRTNPGIRYHSMVREQAIAFKCSKRFLDSLKRSCNSIHLQHSLIEALTKKVYGIRNAGLGDEQIGNIGRFRVTDFWRVHYRVEGGQIVLLEFGPHDMDGIG